MPPRRPRMSASTIGARSPYSVRLLRASAVRSRALESSGARRCRSTSQTTSVPEGRPATPGRGIHWPVTAGCQSRVHRTIRRPASQRPDPLQPACTGCTQGRPRSSRPARADGRRGAAVPPAAARRTAPPPGATRARRSSCPSSPAAASRSADGSRPDDAATASITATTPNGAAKMQKAGRETGPVGRGEQNRRAAVSWRAIRLAAERYLRAGHTGAPPRSCAAPPSRPPRWRHDSVPSPGSPPSPPHPPAARRSGAEPDSARRSARRRGRGRSRSTPGKSGRSVSYAAITWSSTRFLITGPPAESVPGPAKGRHRPSERRSGGTGEPNACGTPQWRLRADPAGPAGWCGCVPA